MLVDENILPKQGLVSGKYMAQKQTVHKNRLLYIINKTTLTSNKQLIPFFENNRSLIDLSIQKFKINQQYTRKQLSINIKTVGHEEEIKPLVARKKMAKDIKSKNHTSTKNAFENIFTRITHKELEKAKYIERMNDFKTMRQLTDLTIHKTKSRNVLIPRHSRLNQSTFKVRLSSFSGTHGQNFCDFINPFEILSLPKIALSLHIFVLSIKPLKSKPLNYTFNQSYINFKEQKRVHVLNLGNFLGFMNNVGEKPKRSLNMRLLKHEFDTDDCDHKNKERCKTTFLNKTGYQSGWMKQVKRLLLVSSLREINHVGYYDIKIGGKKKEKFPVVAENDEEEHLCYFFNKVYKDVLAEQNC